MNLNWVKVGDEVQEEMMQKARTHLKFVCYLYKLQADAGRYYLHEHPIAARSWAEECIGAVMRITGGKIIKLYQCEFGLTSVGDDGVEKPARKTTGMLTNNPAIGVTLARRCKKDHEHTHSLLEAEDVGKHRHIPTDCVKRSLKE